MDAITKQGASRLAYLVGKAGAMVCVLGVLDNLHDQEPVHKGVWVGKLAPAFDRVLEVWTKQCSLKVIHIPAQAVHTCESHCLNDIVQG